MWWWWFMNATWYASVVVGHRAVGFLQVFETSPCRGGAAEI
jgi:hypothetical protein